MNASVASIPPEHASYLTWAVGQSLVAWLALILAAYPFLRAWLGRPKLTVDFFDRVAINHAVGLSNLQLFLNLRNVGSAATRITRLQLSVLRDGANPMILEGVEYFVDQRPETRAAILPPFTVKAGEEWSHNVQFSLKIPKAEQQVRRRLIDALRRDISAKHEATPNEIVRGEVGLVTALSAAFTERFAWVVGEYRAELFLTADDEASKKLATIRFTVYDSEEGALRSHAEEYATGLGVHFFNPRVASEQIEFTVE